MENDKAARCSFCEKPRLEVKWLVAGDRASLCDECIAACNDMLAAAAPDWIYGTPYPLPRRIWPKRRCAFCGTNEAAKFIESSLPFEGPPESPHGHSVCDACVVHCNDHLIAELRTIPGALDESGSE